MNEPAYTIIRVKRKLNQDTQNESSDRFQSFKRLRHIGSFAQKPDETTLASSNLLKQMGFGGGESGSRKRIRISDLNTEQFQAYVERLDDAKTSAKKSKPEVTVTEEQLEVAKDTPIVETSGIFNISLTEEDFVSPQDDNNNSNGMVWIFLKLFLLIHLFFKSLDEATAITCNGVILEEVKISKPEQYVYDYYVLMDNLLDFEERKPDDYVDDPTDADSNDENYRYNDYPDEDEFRHVFVCVI